jgi:hypothetical protein
LDTLEKSSCRYLGARLEAIQARELIAVLVKAGMLRIAKPVFRVACDRL